MYTVFIQMPMGNRSFPHEFLEEAPARKLFDSFVKQIRAWKNYHATVVLVGEAKTEKVELPDAA